MDASVEYAGFWVRAGATLIDSLLIALCTVPFLYWIHGDAYFTPEAMFRGTLDFLLSWVVPAVAIVLFWVIRSATPGKMVFRAVIVDAQSGGKPSRGQCVGRYFGYFVSCLPFFLGILWVAFDKRKQGWHDKLAGTVVIRKPKAPVVFNGQPDR